MMLRAISTPMPTIKVRKIDRDKRDVLIDVGQGVVEAALRLQLAQRHLRGELVDHRNHGGLVVVDRGLQQVRPRRELLGQGLQPVAERGGALRQRRRAARCRSLSARSIMTGIVCSTVAMLRLASSAASDASVR